MEDPNCIICCMKLPSEDQHVLIHKSVTHHTATPLKEVVESTLNRVVDSNDIMCKQCLNLFDEKDRLQKMATDMDSHIMTKVKDVSKETAPQATPAISITVGESLSTCNIKEELERQYKNINLGKLKDLSSSELVVKDSADTSQAVVKRKRGRPKKNTKREAAGIAEPSPPLMVNERQKRKRSEKFNAYLEVLKGEKDFYIVDEDKEEPKAPKRRGGRKKRICDPNITYVEGYRDDDDDDQGNKLCVIQVTDIRQQKSPLRRTISPDRENSKLNLSGVVEEIFGIDSNCEANFIREIDRMDHDEEDLIKVIEFMDTNNVGRSEDDIDLKEFNLNEVDDICTSIKGEAIDWEVKTVSEESRLRAQVLMGNNTKLYGNDKGRDAGSNSRSSPTMTILNGVNSNKPSIEVTEAESVVFVKPNLEVTITQNDDNTLLAVVSHHDEDGHDLGIVKDEVAASSNFDDDDDNGKEISEKFRCKLCQKTFLSKETARAHAQTYHRENLPPTNKLFSCSECNRTFQTAKGRDKHHVQMHLRYTPVQCDECNAPFNSYRPLERHLRNEHDKDPSLHCKNCEEEFVLESSLKTHSEIFHAVSTRKLPKYVNEMYQNNRHNPMSKPVRKTKLIRIVDKVKSNRLFQCPICQEKIFGARALKSHHRKIHNNQEYTCRFCKYRTLCLSTYDRHMVKVHKASTIELYHCLKCQKGFQDPKNLEDHHISFHHAEQNYRCRYCGEAFACTSMLRFHIKSHVAYSCKVCYLGFMKEEALEEHMKTVHNSDCTANGSGSLPGDVKIENSKENLEPPKDDPCAEKSTKNPSASSKVLEIDCDGTVEIKETKVEEGIVTSNPASDKAAVTLHLQQSREGGLEEMDVLNPLKGQKVKDLPKKMKCPVCDKVLTTKFLRTHMLSHKGELPHKCKVCGKAYAQGTLLRKHMKNRHYEEFLKLGNKNPKKHKVNCEFCVNVYNDIYALEDHLWTHMSTKTLECSDCKIRFGMESNLREHYKNHYFKEPQLCPVCKREFKSIGFYNEHVERCQSCWKCEECGLECYTQRYYKKHVRAEHGGDDVHRYQCNLCEKSFMERHRYEDHLITHSSEKNFICSICNKQFKRHRPLNDHIKRCHMGIQLSCPLCNRKSFSSRRELDIHRKTHLKSRRHYLCTTCGSVFMSKEELTTHMKYCDVDKISSQQLKKRDDLKIQLKDHTQSSPNPCPVDGCEKTFRSEGNLRNHISRHHTELIYTCTMCDRRFGSEEEQIQHFTTHANESKFTCLMCGIDLKTEASLDRHMITHTEEKPFECRVCQTYSTPSYSQILSHIHEVHGYIDYLTHVVVKRWCCTACDKMFLVRASLLNHFEEHVMRGEQAQGFVVKTTSSAEVDVTAILNSGSATSASAFIDQVSTLSWEDITPLLRLHINADEAAIEGETLANKDVWQCSGCLLVTRVEDKLRDHLVATPLCQEAVILQMADGFQNTEELEGGSINAATLDSGVAVSQDVPHLSNEAEEWQYVIVQGGESTSKLPKEMVKVKQELKKGDAIEDEEEVEGESMPILVNMDESIQQLLQQPGHGNIQIVVEDSAPLKNFLEENQQQTEESVASGSSNSIVQDNLPDSTSILNGSEVLLQTEDGQLLLQQTFNGVVQYQFVEGVPTASEEEESSSLTLIQPSSPTLSASKFIDELQSQCL